MLKVFETSICCFALNWLLYLCTLKLKTFYQFFIIGNGLAKHDHHLEVTVCLKAVYSCAELACSPLLCYCYRTSNKFSKSFSHLSRSVIMKGLYSRIILLQLRHLL